MTRAAIVVGAVTAIFAGCGESTTATADAAIEIDANCGVVMEIGRCRVAESGADCTGVDGENAVFSPLAEDDTLPIVTGPQALTMFVFSVRATGIEPGNPASPSDADPIIDLQVYRTSYSVVARYRSRVGMVPDSADPSTFVASSLFAVIDTASPITDGQSLEVVGTLRDSMGSERCGRVSFQVEN